MILSVAALVPGVVAASDQTAGANESVTAAKYEQTGDAESGVEPALGADQQAAIGGFGDIEQDHRGDVVTIPVTGVPAGGYVTVTLGEQEAGYISNVTVRDDNGDGDVTLRWNSYLADGDQRLGEDSPWSATGGDTVVNQNVQSTIADGPSHIITAGTYTLAAREGRITGGATERSASALSTLTLTSRNSESVETWTAPESLSGELTSVSDLEAVAGDELTLTDTIAKGDLMVTSIHASGLEGVLQAQDEDTATMNFYGAVADGVITLNHTHLQQSATNRESDTITVNYRETSGDVVVIPDYQNDRYYVVHETSAEDRFRTRRSFRTQFTVEGLARSRANFGLVEPNANGNVEDEMLTSEFDVTPGRISISTTPEGEVEVRARAGQAISGTSTYAPGTELRVRAQATTGSSSQFIIGPREVTVQPDGSWSMSTDFSAYNVGATFRVRASTGDGDEVTANGEIQGEPRVLSLSFPDQRSAGEVVTVSEVEFNAGGFVTIHEGSPSGPIIGHSSYIDENEVTRELLIVLDEPLDSSATLVAMPHVDSNNNQEFDADADAAYTSSGRPITDAARVSLEGAQADFQVSNLSPTDVTINSGDSLTVSARVTNEGDAAGTQSVTWNLDGETIVSRELTLDPGESETVEFSNVMTGELGEGSYTHGIYTDDDSQQATLTIEDGQQSAAFELSSVGPGNVTVGTSQGVSVTATITNTGGTSASTPVDLLLDGSILDRESVSVGAGETRTIEFDEIRTDGLTEGEHTYTVTAGGTSQTSVLTVGTASSGQVESLTFGEQAPGTDEATLESVELSDGGFVAIHEGSASGPVVGVSEYLDGGQQYRNVTISYDESVSEGSSVVAVAHHDTNGNRAFDYASNGSSTDGPYATDASQIAQQDVSSDGSGDGSSGISSSGGIVEEIGLLPLLGVGVLGLGIVGYGLRRFRADDRPAPATGTDQSQPAPEGQAHAPPSNETAPASEPAATGDDGTERGPAGGDPAGTAGAGATGASASDQPQDDAMGAVGSEPPERSQPSLERDVAALSEMVPRETEAALATYGATLATRDGDVPVEVVSIAPDIDVDETLQSEFERAVDQWFNASTHPNVRTVHDRGTEPRPWIALEDLSNVDSLANRHGELSLEQTVDVVGDVVEAVRNVGLYNGTHYNLSPECIRLVADQDGYTAIVDDWGIERIVREHVDGEYITPYTAPEQLGGGPVDDRTDVYGLGAVAYYALTGDAPVPADRTAILNGDISHANESTQMPAQLDLAVMTALSTDPADRHRSPYDFGQSLRSALR